MAGTMASSLSDFVPQLGWVHQVLVSGISVLGDNWVPTFPPCGLSAARWKSSCSSGLSRAQNQDS